MNQQAVIASVGARTSIGLDAKQTGFLYRCGAAGMREAALIDSLDEPITACIQPTLEPYLSGTDRILSLAEPALVEAMAPLGERARSLRLKLIVALDERLDVKPESGLEPSAIIGAALRDKLRELSHENATVEVRAGGGATAAGAIREAVDTLGIAGADVMLVAGVHSDYDPAIVRELEEGGRLFTPDTLDSMIPGEGAAVLLLTSERTARELGLSAAVRVHSIGSAHEPARPDNDESAFKAAGLTVAVRRAAEPLEDDELRAGWILSDATFEMREVNEWQSVLIRSQKRLVAPQHSEFPCHRLGHLGAAALPVMLAITHEAWRRGWAPHDVALLLAGTDSGERAAVFASAGEGAAKPSA